ncbi:MAG: hypothetical protein M1826_000993 [Phylliscum demangeonii]|nr:MAG: hypothetical protein M1826_000993 [Phylliscum demangeonii]
MADDQSHLGSDPGSRPLDLSMTDANPQLTAEEQQNSLRTSLLHCLSAVESFGSFATERCAQRLVIPGLSVEGVGDIGFPLSSHHARKLIGVSRPAPFGKGSQTLVDEDVRKTWEIDGSKLSFANQEEWDDWLRDVIRTVAKDLGVAGGPDNIRPELYKMLLYEKGSMFKPHQDTEKTAGMFGTLVICLPSKHDGGAIHLKHGREEKTLMTAAKSAFNISYLAWYADVSHEVEMVHSGVRWVLTYNLISEVSPRLQSAAGLDVQMDGFLHILRQWRALNEQCRAFCYALNHQYTNENLNLTSLKGHDYACGRYVLDACQKAGDYCVLLATLTKVEREPGENGGGAVNWVMGPIVELGGYELENSLLIPEKWLLQPDLYDERDADSQEGGGYMGNQYADLDKLYHNTVLFICPNAFVTGILLGRGYTGDQFTRLVGRLEGLCKERGNDPLPYKWIVQMYDDLVNGDRNHPNRASMLGRIAVAAVTLADPDLYLKALLDFPPLMGSENDLADALCRARKFYGIHRNLEQFLSGVRTTHVDRSVDDRLVDWIKNRLGEALKSMPEAYPEDAVALVEIVHDYDDGMLEGLVQSFILRFIGKSNFIDAVAIESLDFLQSGIPSADRVTKILTSVLGPAASRFELSKYSQTQERHALRRRPYPSEPDNRTPQTDASESDASESAKTQDARVVVGLYQHVLRSDPTAASNLLQKIERQAASDLQTVLHQGPYTPTRIPPDTWIIPLLEQFLPVLDLSLSNARQFCESLVTTYITICVPREPEKPGDWSQPDGAVTCSMPECVACSALRLFMIDPEQEIGRFEWPKETIAHVRLYMTYQRHSELSTVATEPPVLVIKKTRGKWEEQHSRWQTQALAIRHALEGLPQSELKQALAERFEEMMDLRMVKVPSVGPAHADERDKGGQ